MPTKPVVTGFIFSTDVNYSTGPAPLIGTATKLAFPGAERDEGWKALQAPPAQWTNDLINQITQWTNWVSLGTTAADLDAHLIESDVSGDIAVARAVFGGTANGAGALVASSNAAGAAATFTDTIGSFAVVASTNGTLAAIRGLNTGTGPAIQGVALGTDNIGGDFSGTGTGAGVEASGGSGGGMGVLATGGGVNAGVVGIGGSSGGAGGDFTGDTVDGDGVIGRTNGAASIARSAVLGLATGDAAALRGTPTDGYALVLEPDPTTPMHAAMHLDAQDAVPSIIGNGDIWYNGTRGNLETRLVATTYKILTAEAGFLRVYAQDLSAASNAGATVQTHVTTGSFEVFTTSDEVLVTGTINIGSDGTGKVVEVSLFDELATAVIGDVETFDVFHNTNNANDKSVTIRRTYTVPNTSSRTFSLRTQRTGGAGTHYWDNATIEVVPNNE